MNKTLTISLVTALGVVGGGSYMLMNSDKNFSEYVPEPVTSLIGDFLPDNFKAEQQLVVEMPQSSIAVEESIQINEDFTQVVEDSVQVPEDSVQIEQEVQEVVEENTQEKIIEQAIEQTPQQDVLEQNDENIVELAMQEIQKGLDEVSTPEKITSKNPKAKIIEKKIVDVSTKISKLDMENKELEEKFQNILRKNRELAKQLQAIDKELAQSN